MWNGVVVQLVRIHACHAWGRGFESRPYRKRKMSYLPLFYYFFALKFGDSKKKRTFATHLRGGLNVEWCGSSAG